MNYTPANHTPTQSLSVPRRQVQMFLGLCRDIKAVVHDVRPHLVVYIHKSTWWGTPYRYTGDLGLKPIEYKKAPQINEMHTPRGQ